MHTYVRFVQLRQKKVVSSEKKNMEILNMANEMAMSQDEESSQKPEKKGRLKKRLLACIVISIVLCLILQCLVILVQKLDSKTVTSIIEGFLENAKNETKSPTTI